MKNLCLYLVRHGETEANAAGLLQGVSPGSLTAKGLAQVKKLAQRLKTESIDVIMASDLQRVRQTVAEIAVFHPDVPIKYLPLIREWNVGVFDLRPKAEYRQALADSGQMRAAFRPSEGENYYDVAERAREFLQLLLQEYAGQQVLVCSHGDFIRILIAILLNQPVETALSIPQDNAALSIFELSATGVKTVVINSTDHLNL